MGLCFLRLDRVNCISRIHTHMLSNTFPKSREGVLMWFRTGLHVGTGRRSLGVCLSGCGCSRPRASVVVEEGGISQLLFSCQGKPSLGLQGVCRPPSPLSSLSLPSISPLPLFELPLTGSYTPFSIYTPDQQPVEHTASRTLRNAAVTLQTRPRPALSL